MMFAIYFLLIFCRCVIAQYHIIGTQDISAYTIISKTTKITVTACILSCKVEKHCTLVAHEGDKCLLLTPKGRNEMIDNTTMFMSVVKQIDDSIIMESEVEWLEALNATAGTGRGTKDGAGDGTGAAYGANIGAGTGANTGNKGNTGNTGTGTLSTGQWSDLGCWKDTKIQAIPPLEETDTRLDGDYKQRTNAIQKCYQVALGHKMVIFALQDGGGCQGAKNTDGYKKYGMSNDCSGDGKGGPWANRVYKILGLCYEKDIGYYGHDIKRILKIMTWQNCNSQCESNAKCQYWTWNHTPSYSNYCNLKTSNAGKRYQKDSISGVRGCIGCVKKDLFYSAPVLKEYQTTTTINACFKKCKSQQQCSWITYVPGRNACVLRTKKGAVQRSNNRYTASRDCANNLAISNKNYRLR